MMLKSTCSDCEILILTIEVYNGTKTKEKSGPLVFSK